MKITASAKKSDVSREWYVVDCAEGVTLGRMAVQIAKVLMGKHKPSYTAHVDTGDCVLVINAKKVRMSGTKMEKEYYQHFTGYPSGLILTKRSVMLKKRPSFVITEAVRRMLPKNRLSAVMLSKLRVYDDDKHPHGGQNPKPLVVRKPKAGEMR